MLFPVFPVDEKDEIRPEADTAAAMVADCCINFLLDNVGLFFFIPQAFCVLISVHRITPQKIRGCR